jgi:hypothetical protein
MDPTAQRKRRDHCKDGKAGCAVRRVGELDRSLKPSKGSA